jgi:hypothetical protein
MKRHYNWIKVWMTAAALTMIVVVPAAMAMQEEIVGAVIATGTGYAIVAESGEYIVLDKDLSRYEGDTVAVQGNVEIGAESLVLDHINIIQVLSQKDLIDSVSSQQVVRG